MNKTRGNLPSSAISKFMKRSALLSFLFSISCISNLYCQTIPVTFRFLDPDRTYARVFVPGEFNNWGPNSDGAIAAGAISEMTYNTQFGYWEKEVQLEVGQRYEYKFHYHLNEEGTQWEWISDPRHEPNTGAPNFNSLVSVTNPMWFPLELGPDDQAEFVISGTYHGDSELSVISLDTDSQTRNLYFYYNPANQDFNYSMPVEDICTNGERYTFHTYSETGSILSLRGFCGEPDPGQFVPDWAYDAIWYQIFPERFRNGDPTNDPTRETLEDPSIRRTSWEVSPWTGDWYERAPWEQSQGGNFYANGVFDRRYGGDLQGVLDQLDYLADLGINAIYFNPIWYGRSLHKYDVAAHHHVDPNFGPDPAGDLAIIQEEEEDPSTWAWTKADSLFLQLLAEAHSRDIRVIVDGVFNHSGRSFFAFEDVLENQADSRFAQWYDIVAFDDPNTATNEFAYNSFFGFESLPEFANDASGTTLVAPVREYLFAISERWMDPDGDGDPSDGVDGWRLDAAALVPDGFWQDWNLHVRSINPEVYTVLEEFADASDYIRDGYFSAAMNYQAFLFPLQAFFINQETDAPGFTSRIFEIKNRIDEPNRGVMQNLMESHDTERLASMLVNNSGITNNPWGNENYDVRKPTHTEQNRQELVALFQTVWEGAPMYFYGTESGMWGANDPDDRQPMNWSDLYFEPQTSHPFGKSRPSDDKNFESDLYAFYKQLNGLRNHYTVLRRGEVSIPSAAGQGLVVARTDGTGNAVYTVFNNSAEELTYSFLYPQDDLSLVYTTNHEVLYDLNYTGSGYSCTLPAYGGMVLATDDTFTYNVPPTINPDHSLANGLEDVPYEITLDQLDISDVDGDENTIYTLTLLEGVNYTFEGTKVTPPAEFSGELAVRAFLSDGEDVSRIEKLSILFEPVNDPPTNGQYLGEPLALESEIAYTFSLDDFSATDVDNVYPDDFTLVIPEGEGYTVSNQSVSYGPEAEGENQLTVYLSDGEDSTAVTLSVTVLPAAVTHLPSVQQQLLRVYPNPAEGEITWEWAGSRRVEKVTWLNVHGAEVMAYHPAHAGDTRSVVDWPRGWYFLRLEGDGISVTRRVWIR
ncbi:MAG TPA: hypothetical protein DCE41_34735 [Cytophagales bacterium]|nr:hypothetical protein [Cytophagales bacterium]